MGKADATGIVAMDAWINNNGSVEVETKDGNAYGITAEVATITNGGNLKVESKKGTATGVDIYDSGNITNNGSINVKSVDGDASGVRLDGGHITVKTGSAITVESTNGDAIGLNIEILGNITNEGSVTVNSTDGAVQGIYVNTGNVNNLSSSSVTVQSNKGIAKGIVTVNGSIENEGAVIVTSNEGNAEGIVVKGDKLKNSGSITVTSTKGVAKGVVADDLYNDVTNNGTISVTSDENVAIGIDVVDNSVAVSNIGTITVNSTIADEAGITYGIKTKLGYALDEVAIANNKTADATGIIKVTNNGTVGSVYGLYTEDDDALIQNIGELEVVNNNTATSGSTYAIHAENGSGVQNDGSIKLTSDNGESAAIYGSGDIDNNGTINVTSVDGDAYGIRSTGGKVVNASDITVSSKNGTAFGIYSEGMRVENKDDIKVSSENGTAFGIYSDNGDVINTGTIEVTGSADKIYGIYVRGGTVNNQGTIILNTESCDSTVCDGSETYNNFIVFDEGAVLKNYGLTRSTVALNFDDNNGTTALGKGGVFEAPSLSGTMFVDTSVVEDGFEDTYVENGALQSANVDINAVSNSAMFEANVAKDEGKDSSSVVLTRKSFDELSVSSSVAQFLENNYQQENNSILFAELKKANSDTYSSVEAQSLGYGLLPNFARENFNVLRNLNTVLSDDLFESTGAERKMVGYDYLYGARDTKGTLTGYENYANTMYFMYDTEHDNLVRSGFGMSITQFSSDYDDDSNRKEVMVQALVPVSYTAGNVKYASIARFGYADGEYERQTQNDVFESDLTSWVYGLSNQVRYNADLGFVTIEPTAELNVLGYYQNRIRENKEQRGAIKADAENNLSVEAGIGIKAKKQIEFNQHSDLSFVASAMYYHEFANPYHSLEASMYDMSGTYKITDYEGIYNRDRGVISLGVDYRYKPFTFYGKFRQFVEDENPFEVNAGIKYNF